MKIFKEFFKNIPTKVYLVLILAFILRILWLDQNLFFGFEQGRDLLAVRQIATLEDIKLIGPNTDIQGIYHGALSYYLLLPFYILGFGNPFLIIALLIVVNVAAIIFLYKAVTILQDARTAFVSCLFYALSYSAIIYSRWLSNPNLISPLTILIFYCLARAIKDKRFLIAVAVIWTTIFHLSLASAGILTLPILTFIVFYRIRLNLKVILTSITAGVFIFSPYVIFDFKHGHLLSNNLHKLVAVVGEAKNLINLDQFLNEAQANIILANRPASLLLFLLIVLNLLWLARTNKFARVTAAFLFFPPFTFYFAGILPLRHVFIFTPIFMSISMAIFFRYLTRWRIQYVHNTLLGFLILVSIWELFFSLSRGKNNFLQHSQRTFLGDEKRLIDYVYRDAKGEKFSYDDFTVPYWKSEAWQYLFQWYGKGKYGYLPEPNRTNTFYVLIEPDENQPIFQKNWHRDLDKFSRVVDKYQSGSLTLEKRIHNE